jgi:hypothetical protein
MIGARGATQGWVVPVPPTRKLAVPGIPPGTYYLHTLGSDPRTVTASFVGTLVVEDGETAVSLTLQPQTRTRVSGRIVGDAVALRSLNPAMLQIAVGPALLNGAPTPGSQGPGGTVKPDLTFVSQSWPGRGVILLQSLEPGWTIKSVRLRGVDVTDDGVNVLNGAGLTGLEVELTNRAPQISGVVTNAQGTPVGQYVVLLFPQNRQLWKVVNQRRHMFLARPDQNGRFVVPSVPTGDYLAVALPQASSTTWMDPAFLETLSPRATRVSLKEAESRTLNLVLR